jgi:hypothetical protein
MRAKDIRIGERYVACHCGKTIIVKVESIFQPSKAGETTHIIATNQATGQRISFRSTLGILRPAGPYIDEVKTISDLYVEQIAVPEPGVRYQLRRIDDTECFAYVDYVIRRSDQLFARTSELKEYPITGDGACVLVPSRD